MIKINLVGEGRKVVASKQKAKPTGVSAPSLGGGNLGNVLLATLGVAGLITVGVYWFMLNRTIKSNAEEIQVAERRVAELQEILDQVEEFKRKEAELEQKIEVITDLKNNQKGPVRIMDEISRGLPDLLWLDRLDLQNGQVSLSGRSFSWNAVANLTENLDSVPLFAEPVGPSVTQSGEVYTFTLRFNFDPLAANTAPKDEDSEDESDDVEAGAELGDELDA